jgi:hypothetical protein
VLLDGSATGDGARLCDLSSAYKGLSAAVASARGTVAMGSLGYADPFFLHTGIGSSKSDVYGFGVLLLVARLAVECVAARPRPTMDDSVGLGRGGGTTRICLFSLLARKMATCFAYSVGGYVFTV